MTTRFEPDALTIEVIAYLRSGLSAHCDRSTLRLHMSLDCFGGRMKMKLKTHFDAIEINV